MPERTRRIAAAAWLFLAAVFLFAQYRDRNRPPHLDEVEYLHAALRMERGERIFIDFAEHHSPLHFAMLMPFVDDDARTYVARARAFSAICAAGAVICALLLLARVIPSAVEESPSRAAGSGSLDCARDDAAIIIAAGLIFAAGPVWRNGLGDVRADSPGLLLWWGGTALVLLAKRGWLRGLGIGLVFLAALVCPKWPLASIAVGVAFLIHSWRDVRAWAIAIGTAAIGIIALAVVSDLELTFFHVFELTTLGRTRMVASLQVDDALAWFARCPPMLRPQVVLPLGLLAVLLSRRNAVLFAIAIGAAADLRFIHPYPALDYRFYALWVTVAALVIAVFIGEVATALARFTRFANVLVPAAAVLALFLALDIVPPERSPRDLYWHSADWMQQRLQPGETVWLSTLRHPIGARDANYYWFGYGDLVPVMLAAAQTPRGKKFLPPIGETDLPPCRMERGLDRNLRFIERPPDVLPFAQACFDRLRARGLVARTPLPYVWTVTR